jgi:transcription termination factor Rho
MYEIETLKGKKLTELQEIAKTLRIKRITGLKKMELIYQIIDTVASTPTDENLPKTQKKENIMQTQRSAENVKPKAKEKTKNGVEDRAQSKAIDNKLEKKEQPSHSQPFFFSLPLLPSSSKLSKRESAFK